MNGTGRRILVGAVGIVATTGLVALLQAAIPDRDGVIKACSTPSVDFDGWYVGGTDAISPAVAPALDRCPARPAAN